MAIQEYFKKLEKEQKKAEMKAKMNRGKHR